jgi:hypothetical protein
LGGNSENVETAGMQMKKSIKKNIQLKKGDNGFQWTIIGGSDSTPYKVNYFIF